MEGVVKAYFSVALFRRVGRDGFEGAFNDDCWQPSCMVDCSCKHQVFVVSSRKRVLDGNKP